MNNQKQPKTTSFTLPHDINPASVGNHLATISSHFSVDIDVHEQHLNFSGATDSRRKLARDVIQTIIKTFRAGEDVTGEKLKAILNEKFPQDRRNASRSTNASESFNAGALTMKTKIVVAPRNEAQASYLRDVFNHTVTFGIGPAGTGKTYLAIAAALHSLDNDPKIKKIILCRPAVEAGEKIGFLPGDMTQKIDPYMRPLYDALHEMRGLQQVTNMIKGGEIEIAPLGFMRGRTLKQAFMILDEAQNTTEEQMKMFLTRMGDDSKIVVCGDLTQIDLKGEPSGLKYATNKLAQVEGIAIHRFGDKDVVRHPMVAKMVQAFK